MALLFQVLNKSILSVFIYLFIYINVLIKTKTKPAMINAHKVKELEIPRLSMVIYNVF